MKRRRLLVLLAATAVLSLAGCSLPGAQRYGLAVSQDDLVTTTARGQGTVDHVAWNLPYEPLSLDPAHSFNYSENTVIANMCESLFRLAPDLSIQPGLATGVQQPDPLTQVYTLRDDVTFWDGTPMTAEDVAYSLNRQLDPKTGSYYSNYYTDVASIAATGAHQVTVKFTSPDALFQQAMATAAGAVTEKAFTTKAGEAFGTPRGGVMCTGPFAFAGWHTGQSIVLDRNPHYWDASLQPHAKKLEFSFIADESTAVNALRSGEVDGQFFFLPPAGLIQLQKNDDLTVDYGRSLAFFALVALDQKGPLGDVRVRQALSALIDRGAEASVVMQGAALPTAVLTGPDYWGYDRSAFASAASAFTTRTDPTRAKQLLAEAKPTKPIVIGIQGSSAVHEQTANVIQAAGKALGLDIRIKVIPVEQYGNLYSDPKARAGLDAFLTTFYGNVADPLDVYAVFAAGGPSNYGDYTGVSDAVASARSTIDPTQRAQKVIDIQKKVEQDAPWLPLVNLPTILVQNDRITGATASMAYLYYPWAAAIGTKGKK